MKSHHPREDRLPRPPRQGAGGTKPCRSCWLNYGFMGSAQRVAGRKNRPSERDVCQALRRRLTRPRPALVLGDHHERLEPVGALAFRVQAGQGREQPTVRGEREYRRRLAEASPIQGRLERLERRPGVAVRSSRFTNPTSVPSCARPPSIRTSLVSIPFRVGNGRWQCRFR